MNSFVVAHICPPLANVGWKRRRVPHVPPRCWANVGSFAPLSSFPCAIRKRCGMQEQIRNDELRDAIQAAKY